MKLIEECLKMLNDIENDLDIVAKREINSIDEIFERVEWCSQKTREIQTDLEKINRDLNNQYDGFYDEDAYLDHRLFMLSCK